MTPLAVTMRRLTRPGKWLVWLLLVCLAATAGRAEAESKPIVFLSTDTPPFWSPTLPDNGVGGAALGLVSAAAGVSYAIEYLPIKRFRRTQTPYMVGDPENLVSQEHRAIFPIGIFRSAVFYYKPHHAVIDFDSLQDLRGYTLGALRGTIEDKDYFVRHGVNIEETNSIPSLLQMLKRGRIDVCIIVAGTGRHTIRRLFPDEQDQFAQIILPALSRPLTIIIDTSTPEGREVARRYGRVLEKTLHSQRYREILENYYGKDGIPGNLFDLLDKFVKTYASTWGN